MYSKNYLGNLTNITNNQQQQLHQQQMQQQFIQQQQMQQNEQQKQLSNSTVLTNDNNLQQILRTSPGLNSNQLINNNISNQASSMNFPTNTPQNSIQLPMTPNIYNQNNISNNRQPSPIHLQSNNLSNNVRLHCDINNLPNQSNQQINIPIQNQINYNNINQQSQLPSSHSIQQQYNLELTSNNIFQQINNQHVNQAVQTNMNFQMTQNSQIAQSTNSINQIAQQSVYSGQNITSTSPVLLQQQQNSIHNQHIQQIQNQNPQNIIQNQQQTQQQNQHYQQQIYLVQQQKGNLNDQQQNIVTNQTVNQKVNHPMVQDNNFLSVIYTNPIIKYFHITKYIGTMGPELAWNMYAANRIGDNKEFTVLFFDKRTAERPQKPKRKELVVEVLRKGYANLFQVQHNCPFTPANQNNVHTLNLNVTSKFLQIVHKLEETEDTLAFAVEPLFGSLANITGYLQRRLGKNVPSIIKDYSFLEFEVKYGFTQLAEALMHLHNDLKSIHRNICPQSILINKKGTWKLAGLEFAEKCNFNDYMSPVSTISFINKLPKITQPDLNFSAPECELNKCATPKSDIFSLGLVILSLFNDGLSPLNCDLNTSIYLQKLEVLSATIEKLKPCLNQLSQPIQNLLERDFRRRPSIQELLANKYFDDSGIQALQYLDMNIIRDVQQKNKFYQGLPAMMHLVPKKLWFQHLIPNISNDFNNNEILSSALDPVLHLISESTKEEFKDALYPYIRPMFSMAKTNQALVSILENVELFLEKSNENDLKNDILPIILNAFNSNSEIQSVALTSLSVFINYYNEPNLKKMLIQRLKLLFDVNPSFEVQEQIINCIQNMFNQLDEADLSEDIFPLLARCDLYDPELLMSIINLYKKILECDNCGLSLDFIATKILPDLIPAAVNQELTLEQFQSVSETLQTMLTLVTSSQRSKISIDSNAQRLPNIPPDLTSNGNLSPNITQLINTYNNQLQNKSTNSNKSLLNTNQQSSVNKNPINDKLDELSYKVSNIKLNKTDNNNNTMTNTMPLVKISTTPTTLRKGSSKGSNLNLTISRPTTLKTNENTDSNQNNLLSVNNNGMKSRRHSDNAINVPKIEIAPSSPTTNENMSIAKAASSSNLSGRRFSSISPEDLAEFQANRKDRKNSSTNLDLGFSMNKRRHSSINPNDLKNMANKVTRAADDLIMSTTEKITDTKKYPGLGMTLDFPLTGLNTKRNRRSSVSVFLGQNSILPSSGGSSGSKLFQKFSTKKPKKPQSTSQKILQHIESGMSFLKPK